jgi:hypothetical protein
MFDVKCFIILIIKLLTHRDVLSQTDTGRLATNAHAVGHQTHSRIRNPYRPLPKSKLGRTVCSQPPDTAIGTFLHVTVPLRTGTCSERTVLQSHKFTWLTHGRTLFIYLFCFCLLTA